MTIREAGAGKVAKSKHLIPYLVGFNGNDETELDVRSLEELEELWKSLCPEFGCKEDSVDYVERA